jgi:F-type H+-transporting ATPase subunit b
MPLNINLQQIFLHLFNFGLLVIGLYFILYKPVVKFMEKREEHYASLEQAAQKKLAEAEEEKAKEKEALAKLDQELDQIREEKTKALNDELEAREARAKQQAQEILDQAEKDAQALQQNILEQANAKVQGLVEEKVKDLLIQDENGVYQSFAEKVGKGGDHGHV